MTEANEAHVGFVGYLEGLARRDDRGALAALRRGLGKEPGEAAEMFPYVVRWTGDRRGWSEEVYYLVASLFALHPETWHGAGGIQSNLGASLIRAAGPGGDPGIERRFVAMLDSNTDTLPDHLRHAVALCKAAEVPVPVDWGQLLRQLPHWNAGTRWVQRDWARAYWRAPTPGEDAGETDESE